MGESLHIGHTPIRGIKIPDSLWDAIPNANKSEYVRKALESQLKKEGKK